MAFCLGPRSLAQQTGTAPSAGPERVAGKVVSKRDGHPIPQASLSLQDNKTNKVVAETTSGGDGSYRFDPVPPGRYRLAGQAKGYLPAAYLQQGALSSAIVTGQGLATGALLLELAPQATVQGRILSEAGEPVQRATVALYREREVEGNGGASAEGTPPGQRMFRARSIQTNDEGRYAFSNLEEGRYFLTASGTPWYAVHPAKDDAQNNSQLYRTAVDPALNVAYPTIYYPGALRSDQATAIVLHGGEVVTADVQMVPVPAVTITLQRSPGPGLNQAFPIVTRSVFGVPELIPVQGSITNGLQQISGLAPGEYAVQQFGDGNRAPVQLQTVDLTAGSATVNLASPTDLSTVTVQVRALPGATLPTGLQLNLRDLRLQRRYAGTRVDEKGAAEFANVPPGEYRPVLIHQGTVLPLASVTVNGKPLADRRLRLSDPTHLEVVIVAAGDPVTVTGVVQRSGKPAVGVLMVLVPAGGDTSDDLFRRDQTDLDGGFTCANVAPGEYIAVAIEGGSDLLWTDLRTLSKYLPGGVPVAVRAGSARTVRLSEAVPVQAP